MRSLVILAVVAAAAIVLYALAPYLANVVTGGGATQTAQTSSSAAQTTQTAAPAPSRTTETGRTTTTSAGTPTSAPPTATQTATSTSLPPTASSPPPAMPNMTLALETKEVNATRLPAAAVLRFRVENAGAARGALVVNGTAVELDPGGSAELNFTAVVSRAGANYILLYVNGTPRLYEFEVLYYTPVFVAEPVAVEVYRLPASVSANVTVKNVGNYTGYFGGIAVPPGGNATVAVRVNATAAGRYYVDVGGVEVEVDVVYLAVGYAVRAQSPALEAVPGEPVPVYFLVENTGNATEALYVNGTRYVLRPGGRLQINSTVPAYSRRPVALVVNGTLWRWTLNVSTIAVRALLKIGGGIYNPALSPQIVISSSQSAVPYTWVLTTNATRRSVALAVGGSTYLVPPGGRLLINGTLQAALNAWNTVSITVNGTTYAVQVYVQLEPPTLYVGQITGMSFTDSRIYEQYPTCRTPIGSVSLTVKVYSVSGSVSYSGNTIYFSGSITAYVNPPGETRTVGFSGSSTNGVGQVTATIGSYTVVVKFSGGSVTEVDVNGQPVACGSSIIPVPPFMYQKPPGGTIDAVSFATEIADLFAKGPSDYITNAYYNGRSVVLVDAAGHTMTYSGGSIGGPLQVDIYGQISQTS